VILAACSPQAPGVPGLTADVPSATNGLNPTPTLTPSDAQPTPSTTEIRTPTPEPEPSLTQQPTAAPVSLASPTAQLAAGTDTVDEAVSRVFEAFLAGDEATLLKLYSPEAAELCTAAFGSISQCIGAPYWIRGLLPPVEWQLFPDEPAEPDAWIEVEIVISKWSNDERRWQHAFFLEKVGADWLIIEPKTKIAPYEE
jgi:hypothetical protein